MAGSSFDIEAGLDLQEVDNAVNQAAREVGTRYDFKGTDTTIVWESRDADIRIRASTEDRARAALQVLEDKLVKRKVPLKGIDAGEPAPAGGATTRIDIALRTDMPADVAREIVKQIKASKLKVGVTNMGDRIRVTSKSRDALQEVIALVRAQDYPAPLRFTNYQ